MSKSTVWLRGRNFRHGFRVEGLFIEREFGKKHLFFQSRREAEEFMYKEAKSRLNGGVGTK